MNAPDLMEEQGTAAARRRFRWRVRWASTASAARPEPLVRGPVRRGPRALAVVDFWLHLFIKEEVEWASLVIDAIWASCVWGALLLHSQGSTTGIIHRAYAESIHLLPSTS